MSRRPRNKELKDSQIIDIETARRERRARREILAENLSTGDKQTCKELTRRRTVKNLKRRVIYGLIMISFIVVIGVSAYNVLSLLKERADAEARLSTLETEKKILEEELSKVDSVEYIEQQAREQLRMILPGEILYILKESENAEDKTED